MVPFLKASIFCSFGSFLSLVLFSACTFDTQEYDELKNLREEYIAEINELRQMNEILNRNITATYLELESLKARLAEMEKRHS
jgi:hypothetical protein